MSGAGTTLPPGLCSWLPPLGRLLMCGLFLWSGTGTLTDPAGTAGYIASLGLPLPGVVAWVTVVVELGGGLALLLGWKARWAAILLAAWCLATAVVVHLAAGLGSADAGVAFDNMIHFYKNLAMAGGLLYVAAFGAGRLSIDRALRRD